MKTVMVQEMFIENGKLTLTVWDNEAKKMEHRKVTHEACEAYVGKLQEGSHVNVDIDDNGYICSIQEGKLPVTEVKIPDYPESMVSEFP